MAQDLPDRTGQTRCNSLTKKDNKVSFRKSTAGVMGFFAEEDIKKNEVVLEYKV